MLRKLKLLGRSLMHLASQPARFRQHMRYIWQAWRQGGMPHLKHALISLPQISVEPSQQASIKGWALYRQHFAAKVRPKIVAQIAQQGTPVAISILVPTYNTPADMLREMIASVQAQLYPRWELCIADDASTEPHVRAILQEAAQHDPRIKLHLGEHNCGVSHATNQALALATSPFCVLLDHDDLLEEQAIFRVAQSVVQDDPDMLYSDEVLISADGSEQLYLAYRPGFSPEYLRGHPYIVHLAGFRTELLHRLGGLDERLNISQDYDLILRASEQARTIVHIPEILYQWRVHETSAGHQKADAVMQTSSQLLTRHLQRSGVAGCIEPSAAFNFFIPRYPLGPGLRVAIIIPTKNHGALVRQCIDSILATVTEADYDIFLIDHASTDPDSLAYFQSLGPAQRTRVLRHEGPFNFSAINNRAIAQIAGPYTHYLLCNNDIEALRPGWLEHMLSLAQHPDVGITGAQLLYPDRTTIQHAGVCVGAYGAAEHYGKFLTIDPEQPDNRFHGPLLVAHEVGAVTAACLLIRKDAWDAVRGMDETLAVGFGDVDLCLRVLQQGWRIVQCPQAVLVHHESISRGKSATDPHPEDSALFTSRWASFIAQGDPYHNPNLEAGPAYSWLPSSPLRCRFNIQRRIYQRDPATGRQRLHHA